MKHISEVYNKDCMEYMATIPDKFFDLAIVDPPYGLPKGAVHGSGKLKNRALNSMDMEWDIVPSDDYFKELFRVSKNQIIWGGNYFNLHPTRGIICWDKMQPWENFSQIELAWTSFDKPAKLFKCSTTGGANAEKKIHPTQKPVALYAWQLKTFAKPGYKIFDSHLGSGSNRIAAYKLGFYFYATEINTGYFNDQDERFKRECFSEIKTSRGTLVQQSLFQL